MAGATCRKPGVLQYRTTFGRCTETSNGPGGASTHDWGTSGYTFVATGSVSPRPREDAWVSVVG